MMQLNTIRLQKLLLQNNLKQRDLADKVGVTEVSMSRYVHGTRMPRWNVLMKMAEALHTTSDYLTEQESTKMNNLKRITIEIPESTYLMDLTYYWNNGIGIVKTNCIFDEDNLKDGKVVVAWSNRYTKTEEK